MAHGTSIGGARPKALLDDEGRHLIAKFSSSSDDRPVVKAEAVGMLLAARCGATVAPVTVVRADGKDVLLVERFDRTTTPKGPTRRGMVSMLTILGLSETSARYASYAGIAQQVRTSPLWLDVPRVLTELFLRLVVNIVVGNTDDHLRNTAAFWDGTHLRLTPAYDVAPQRRTTQTGSQAIAITADGQRASQLRLARSVAPDFHLSVRQADDVIDQVLTTVHEAWDDVCDEATLTRDERAQLWGREINNPYIRYAQP